MHEAAAVPSWVLLAYLIAGICFILALRGLSSPDSSRRGNLIGMAGMAIAVVTTLIVHAPLGGLSGAHAPAISFQGDFIDLVTAGEILIAIAIGATVGLVTARRIQMTAMPQLVAAFHSLVSLPPRLVPSGSGLPEHRRPTPSTA